MEEKLFNLINRQLRSNNLEIKQGKCYLTDASIIESSKSDNQGDYVKRKNQATKGYKTHMLVNQKDDLVEAAILTTASCHESMFLERVLDKLDDKKVEAVVADKGYVSKDRKRQFRQKGIYYGIMERKGRGKSLTKKQKFKNQRLAKIRAKVERVFAVIKKHYGWNKTRYLGLKNNTSHMWNIYSAYNLQLVALGNLRTINSS